MELILYKNFSKKSNSTKQPTGSGIVADVKLKDRTTVEAPTFLINGIDLDVNYCKWNNAYYFVNTIVLSNNNIYELICSIDLLATYKANILNTTALIAYATNGDSRLADARLPIIPTPTYSVQLGAEIFNKGAGDFILSVTGEDSAGFYVVDSITQLNKIFTDFDWFPDLPPEKETGFAVIDVGNQIVQAIKSVIGTGSLAQNIRACFWMPYIVPTSSQARLIKIGMYVSQCLGIPINEDEMLHVTQQFIPIPWQYDDWRNQSPYTYIYVYLPFVGLIPFDSNQIQGQDTISLITSISVTTGDVAYELKCGNIVLGAYNANIAVQVPIGASNISFQSIFGNGSGILASAAAVGTAIATKNIAGAVGAGVAGTTQLLSPLTASIGGAGGSAGAGLEIQPKVFTVCHNTVAGIDNLASVQGIPYGHKALISTLGEGYIQSIDISVEGAMHEDERTRLNALVNGGIYIE